MTAINSDFADDGETTSDDLRDILSVFGKAAPRYHLDVDVIIEFGDFLRFAADIASSG